MPKKPRKRLRTLFNDTVVKERAACLINIFLKQVVDPDNDNHFHLVFKAFLDQGVVGIDQAADGLFVSKSTVRCWARGRNLPNRHIRPAIYQWLSEKATEHFRQS